MKPQAGLCPHVKEILTKRGTTKILSHRAASGQNLHRVAFKEEPSVLQY